MQHTNTSSMSSGSTTSLFYRDLGARWQHDDSRWRPKSEFERKASDTGFTRSAPLPICGPDWKGVGMQWNRRCKVLKKITVCCSFYFRSCTDTIPLCGVRGVWSEEKHMDHGALRSGPALVRTARLWTDLAAATFSPGSASELGCSGQAGQTARRARTLPHRACTLPHRACGGMRSACPPQLRPLTM